MLKKIALGLMIVSLGFSFGSSAYCAETKKDEPKFVDGMKQGDFAMLLLKDLGAEGQLPPAATLQDAFKFLEKIGVVPPKGWDEKGVITKADLVYMLGLKKEEADKLNFDEILTKLEKRVADILWSLGIRVVAPQTVSPAGG